MHLSSAWVRLGQWLLLAAVLLVGLTFLQDNQKRIRDGPVYTLTYQLDADAITAHTVVVLDGPTIIGERPGESWFQTCIFIPIAKPGAPIAYFADDDCYRTLDEAIAQNKAPPRVRSVTATRCKTALTY